MRTILTLAVILGVAQLAEAGYYTTQWNGYQWVRIYHTTPDDYYSPNRYVKGSYGFTLDIATNRFYPAYIDTKVTIPAPRNDIHPGWWFNRGRPTGFFYIYRR